jgi:hypothetical protein
VGFLNWLFEVMPSQAMVAGASHKQLIGFLLPKQFKFDDKLEKIAAQAETRLLLELPQQELIELYRWGLNHEDEAVRAACSERLCDFADVGLIDERSDSG